jgi:hypothetical protein
MDPRLNVDEMMDIDFERVNPKEYRIKTRSKAIKELVAEKLGETPQKEILKERMPQFGPA